MLSKHRYRAAVLLLLIMAGNFVAEGCTLVRAHLAALTIAEAPVACAAPASAGEAKHSCCAKKPEAKPAAKSCGCPHCGDHCPMGDACTCGQADRPRAHAEAGTLFFALPQCHPEQDVSSAEYLPFSMRIICLQPAAVMAQAALLAEPAVADLAGAPVDSPRVPPTPPPRA